MFCNYNSELMVYFKSWFAITLTQDQAPSPRWLIRAGGPSVNVWLVTKHILYILAFSAHMLHCITKLSLHSYLCFTMVYTMTALNSVLQVPHNLRMTQKEWWKQAWLHNPMHELLEVFRASCSGELEGDLGTETGNYISGKILWMKYSLLKIGCRR